MDVDSLLTLFSLLIVLITLIFSRVPADVVMMGALTLLLVGGVLTVPEALEGLSNPGMVTVGGLFVVVAGVKETGGLGWIVQQILGSPKSEQGALHRLMLPIIGLSAFLNNTPVVAMMIPAVREWSKRIGISPSKLMIPLSYASILGGMCTLIGTSTNLVVNGLYMQKTGGEGLSLFTISAVGIPCALAGLGFVVVIGRRILPDRGSVLQRLKGEHRQYTITMQVPADSPLVDKSIQEAGLRNLPGVYLFEIQRENSIHQAVPPSETIKEGDLLVFAGVVDSVKDLLAMRGLVPATDQAEKLGSPAHHQCLMEAVVSENCPVVGLTIKEGRFRNLYNAAVLAVARNGERIIQKLGDVTLKPGDTLLLQAADDFHAVQRNSRDFYLISKLEDSVPVRHKKAIVTLLILMTMVACAGFGLLSMLQAVFLAAGAMLVLRCCSINSARKSVDWSVLVVISSAFALGKALEKTGLSGLFAETLLALAGDSPWLSLVIVYLITTLFTELITNNAAVVLTFPIAVATSEQLGCELLPFVMAVMVAGSASFASPLGYQTNLMVMGPGGYRFADYMKVGVMMNVLIGLVAVTSIPMIWGFK